MRFKNQIFCAIDFTNLNEATNFVSKISSHLGGIKLGLEFFMKNGYQGVKEMKKIGLPIFLDLKLNDIPNTVEKAAQNILDLEPEYLSVHINGGLDMLKKLVSIKHNTKILGVSLLTSLNNKDLKSFGFQIDSKEYVKNLLKIGVKAKIDGIVSSAYEVPHIKKIVKNPKFTYVTPGIRLPEDSTDDQKRIITPGEAVKLGASILIIGRSITQSKKPIKKIEQIFESIEAEIDC